MRVLVGCEFSGVVRDAFARRGHDAWSCDFRPTAVPGKHYQCDVREVLNHGWDLAIFHPDCTFVTISAEWAYGPGPYHQKVKPGTLVGAARAAAREEALGFVQLLLDADIPRIALENPVGVIGTRIRPASQTVQPYEFGDDASKRTCLWLKGLPLLRALPEEQWAAGRDVMQNGKLVRRWANQTDSGQNRLTPSAERGMDRAVTYQGIANAMAEQWGGLL